MSTEFISAASQPNQAADKQEANSELNISIKWRLGRPVTD